MNCIDQIREFVVLNYLFGDGATLQDDTSFLESGIVDSTGILGLIEFLETTYEIKVEREDMIPANLDGVARAAAFVARKRAALRVV